MEALKAASFRPMSVLSEKRSEPRKVPSLPNLPSPKAAKPISQASFLRSCSGGLAFLSSVLSTYGPAKSLTYEEALQQSVTSSSSSSDFDISGVLDGIISFGSENPLVIAGGVAVLGVPLVLSQILNKKPKPWGTETAKSAYSKLGLDENAQLLDIRAQSDIRQVGSPNVKGLGKKSVSVAYKGEDKPGFLKKLSLKFKDPENTTLFILDKFDGNSELVAELVALNGFKAAYAIKDGAEGPRGWINSTLPWIEPTKTFSLDLSGLTESISSTFGEGAEGLSVTLGIAAATGLGLLAFSEVETLLQLLGSAAIVQFASKKLLFAEDRKKTLKQVDEFLNTKVAPKELADELKQIGKALLPAQVSSKSLPAPAEASPEPTISKAESAVGVQPEAKAEPIPEAALDVKPEAKAEPIPEAALDVKPEAKPEPIAEAAAAAAVPQPPSLEVNSVPEADAKAVSHSGLKRPLSPYASYPDLKPPASPTPSQP